MNLHCTYWMMRWLMKSLWYLWSLSVLSFPLLYLVLVCIYAHLQFWYFCFFDNCINDISVWWCYCISCAFLKFWSYSFPCSVSVCRSLCLLTSLDLVIYCSLSKCLHHPLLVSYVRLCIVDLHFAKCILSIHVWSFYLLDILRRSLLVIWC